MCLKIQYKCQDTNFVFIPRTLDVLVKGREKLDNEIGYAFKIDSRYHTFLKQLLWKMPTARLYFHIKSVWHHIFYLVSDAVSSICLKHYSFCYISLCVRCNARVIFRNIFFYRLSTWQINIGNNGLFDIICFTYATLLIDFYSWKAFMVDLSDTCETNLGVKCSINNAPQAKEKTV